tara:strand:+ start:1080 stop:1367 length:288 start_codon:yes stop_codon:yes gene_type:complete
MIIENISLENLIGFTAAILTTVAFMPQLIRTWSTKSADDVSIYMLILFITGVSFWIIYGWKVHAAPILIANIITLILNLSILILKIFYESKAKNT